MPRSTYAVGSSARSSRNSASMSSTKARNVSSAGSLASSVLAVRRWASMFPRDRGSRSVDVQHSFAYPIHREPRAGTDSSCSSSRRPVIEHARASGCQHDRQRGSVCQSEIDAKSCGEFPTRRWLTIAKHGYMVREMTIGDKTALKRQQLSVENRPAWFP